MLTYLVKSFISFINIRYFIQVSPLDAVNEDGLEGYAEKTAFKYSYLSTTGHQNAT
jgi:hypothetical protein